MSIRTSDDVSASQFKELENVSCPVEEYQVVSDKLPLSLTTVSLILKL